MPVTTPVISVEIGTVFPSALTPTIWIGIVPAGALPPVYVVPSQLESALPRLQGARLRVDGVAVGILDR